MVVSAMVKAVDGNGFRAWTDIPYPASAEGATRDEALTHLREVIEQHVRDGVEVVRLRIGPPPVEPIWPDDELTRQILDGIATARAKADATPDPWYLP